MVKVLANGDIVPDDDPRASAGLSHSRTVETSRPRQGYINQDDNVADAEMAGGESTSVFGSLNQRLVAAGVPTWHIATYSVEPIVSVGFLLSFLLAGFRGLLFSAVLFFVVKYSRFGTSENRGRNTSAATSNSNRPAPSAPSAARGNWPRDGGHRLGYS